MKITIELFDRFPDVYQSERGRIEAALKAHLGIQ
jgi:hypothetical protein